MNSARSGSQVGFDVFEGRRSKMLAGGGSRLSLGPMSSVAEGSAGKSRTTTGMRRTLSGIARLEGQVTTTFTDLFLNDSRSSSLNEQSSSQRHDQIVPLPPGLVAIVQAKEKEERQSYMARLDQRRHDEERSFLNKDEILQEYFKNHAIAPREFTALEEARERLHRFIEIFNVDIGLHRHCGERLKCTAYVNIRPQKVAVRSQPSTSQEFIVPNLVIHPGEMVVADQILVSKNVKYLKLRQGGWTFERKGPIRCMSYVACMETGLWWYRVVCQEYAEVRHAPGFSEKVRTGHVLCPGELCVVSLRCFVDDRCWLCLADGRGWIFERKPPPVHSSEDANSTELREFVMAECIDDNRPARSLAADVTDEGLIGSVELGMWEYECVSTSLAIGASYVGVVVEEGDRVFIDLRVPANGQRVKAKKCQAKPTCEDRIWLRLQDGLGWVAKTNPDGSAAFRFIGMAVPGRLSITSPQKRAPKRDVPDDNDDDDDDTDWMEGIA